MNINLKSLLNLAAGGLSLYAAIGGVRQLRRDYEDYRIASDISQREGTHNQLHTEESGILYHDYVERIKTSLAYLDKFRDESRPDRRCARKVYHSSQQAQMSDAQLATLFAAALGAEHYPLEYFEIFKDQTLIYKPYQCRYVRAEEIHNDPVDLFVLSYQTDELAEVETYIHRHLSTHLKKPVIRFIAKHRKMLLEELKHSHAPIVEESPVQAVA